MPAPKLEPHCGSWIITTPTGMVLETFSRRNADMASEAPGYKVETALEYLSKLNRAAR